MKFKTFLKLMERETLLFISMMLFSCILLPTFIMLVMTFYAEIPRAESIFRGYRYLFESIGETKWIAFGITIGPYALLQLVRTTRWVLATKHRNPH